MAVRSEDCEIWANKGWHRLTIIQALGYPRDRLMRCPECFGSVRWHKAGADNLPPAHFEHHQRHEGCSRSDAFNGVRSPHPQPARPR